FRSVTGRNQPRKFIFGAPKWMRSLAVPAPGHVLCYADYSAQEIGIAAALSGDAAMKAMYGAPDPHMEFAAMAGAVPIGANSDALKAIRKTFKTVNLAVLYGQSSEGIATRLGIETHDARQILLLHRQFFATYHAWSSRVTNAAYTRGYATTRQGWRATVDLGSRWRTWANFPIQGGGAEVMRCTTIAMDRLGLEVLAVVHDGWLIECRAGDEGRVHDAVRRAGEWACRHVLGGFPLRMDWQVFPDRFVDDSEGTVADWAFIMANLPKEVLRVPAE
ncbi:MAG TPA: DNA polymerase, partial [Urbifossiella sp.]|nr:DNA polymerase [Urbifossiella sp.]